MVNAAGGETYPVFCKLDPSSLYLFFTIFVFKVYLQTKFVLLYCRILTSLSLGGSYPRLLGREKLWLTASFPYLGAGRTQLQPMRSWYFSRTSDVTLGDYGPAVGRSH